MSKMNTYFTFENLYRAYLDCRKRKTRTLNHLVFAENLEENLLDLEEKLQNRTYKPGRSIAFVVQRPKIREIFAADFRDRVVHHLLFNYLSPIFEKIFIYDSWACRKGKGTHGAMLRLQKFASELERELSLRAVRRGNLSKRLLRREYTSRNDVDDTNVIPATCLAEPRREAGIQKQSDISYYFQGDIRSFFTSIDQQILYNLIEKKVKNKEILWLVKTIVFHDCARDIPPKIQSPPFLFDKLPPEKSLFKISRGKGLPIGNLTSQFFANVYMNELDQFVKHILKAKYYVRYVDDFLILGRSEEELKIFRDKISCFLMENLGLRLHPKKQKIVPLKNGIDFVGYVVRSEYILVRRRVVGQMRRKMEWLESASRDERRACLKAYWAHFSFANSFGLKIKFML